MKKVLLLLLLFIPISVFGITNKSTIKDPHYSVSGVSIDKISDENEYTYEKINANKKIQLNSKKNIYGLYIIYYDKEISGYIEKNDENITIGNKGLHEYIDIKNGIGNTNNVDIIYNQDVKISEIYVIDDEVIPDFVEIWEEPYNVADLVLFSTHSDDEQLFFAGLIPHYINEDKKVQIVYFAHHNDNPKRLHEQLHGLYAVGVRNYPIFGIIPDKWSENLEDALKNMNNAKISEDDATQFMVENIRRFKPKVVVGHDELGEYSHGQHILNTYILKKALELTNDGTYHEYSASKYGVWDVPKTYLHLYEKDKIIMNYDLPLAKFNGKTAYEVSKEGYSKHETQQYTWFTKWLTGVNSKNVGTKYENATEIKKYSPLEYGLYRTKVGLDNKKNDMFENIEDTKKEDNVKKENKKKSNNKNNNQNYYYYYYYYLPIIIAVLIILIKPKKNKGKK